MPPTGATRSTIHLGLPNEVTKTHTFFHRDIQPLFHTIEVNVARFFRDHIHTDGFIGKSFDLAQTFAEIHLVCVHQTDRLHDADTARLGRRRHQFPIAARVHRPANNRDFNFRIATELGLQQIGGHWLLLVAAASSIARSFVSNARGLCRLPPH